QVVEHQLNLSTHQVGESGCAALVRYVRHVDARHGLEQLARKMDRCPASGGGEVELTGLFLGKLDQVGNRVDRQAGRDLENVGHAGDQNDRDEILHVVVGHLGVKAGIDRMRADGSHEQRIAVGGALGDQVRADIASCAGPV